MIENDPLGNDEEYDEDYVGPFETGSGPLWLDEEFLQEAEKAIRKLWPPEIKDVAIAVSSAEDKQGED